MAADEPIIEMMSLDQVGPVGRRLRQELGLTLRELDRRCGLSPGYLSQLERSDRTPSFPTWQDWFGALGVQVVFGVVSAPVEERICGVCLHPYGAHGAGTVPVAGQTAVVPTCPQCPDNRCAPA